MTNFFMISKIPQSWCYGRLIVLNYIYEYQQPRRQINLFLSWSVNDLHMAYMFDN